MPNGLLPGLGFSENKTSLTVKDWEKIVQALIIYPLCVVPACMSNSTANVP